MPRSLNNAEKVTGKSGGLVRESLQHPLNSGLGIILICPEQCKGMDFFFGISHE